MDRNKFVAKVVVVVFIVLTFLVMIYCKMSREKTDIQSRNASENHASITRRAQRQPVTSTMSATIEHAHLHRRQHSQSDIELQLEHPNQKMKDTERIDFVANILRTRTYVKPTSNNKNQTSDGSSQIFRQSGECNKKNTSLDECTICMEPFHNGEEICTSHNSACPHCFHHKCILRWLRTSKVCPCCRQNYLHFDVELGQSETDTLASSTGSLQSIETQSKARNDQPAPVASFVGQSPGATNMEEDVEV